MSIRNTTQRSKPALSLLLAILISHPLLHLSADELPAFATTPATSSHQAVDYRHMALYQLKLNRYYHPSSPGSATVTHSHHHSYWGWWDIPFFFGGGYTNDRNSSFSDRVSDNLLGAAVIVTVVAITAITIYSVSHALWPYTGATSLTAIELPGNSPWKITDYKAIHGRPIRYPDLAFNEDAIISARQYEMFDRQTNPQGHFLLVDQEDWWGVIDYPVDIDVTFTRFDELFPESSEQITVNIKRTVTNGLKSGNLSSEVVHTTQNRQNYQLVANAIHPDWFDFSSWYHKPTQLIVDLKTTGYR